MVKKTGHLSEQEKIRAITTFDSGKRTYAQVGRILKRKSTSVKRWIGRLLEGKSIQEKKHSGRKPILSEKACKAAYQLLAKNGRMSSTHVAEQLHSKNLCNKIVYRTTVVAAARRYAKDKGLANVVANWSNPKRRLSEANKQQRLEFCRENINRDWASVMFIDRCKFTLKYPGVERHKQIWRPAGEPCQEYFPTKPTSMYNVYGGITIHGPTKLIPVTGTTGTKLKTKYKTKRQQNARSITQSEYTVVAQDLLTEGHRLFKGQPWALVQDNDKVHKGMHTALKDWNKQHSGNASLIKFPPNSPDLNLIENVWGYITSKVEAAGCKSSHEFQEQVDKQFSELSDSYLKKLFSNMARRIKECIQKEGDRTGH